MKFNKKYLLIIPLVIIVIATVKFIKDKLSPMRISGTVEATQVILSSRISSNIKNIAFNEGDSIKKDIVLVNLDCEDINVTYARLLDDYDRAKKLLSSGAGSKPIVWSSNASGEFTGELLILLGSACDLGEATSGSNLDCNFSSSVMS